MKKSKILSIICAAVMVMGGVFAAGCEKEENIKIESNKETVSSDNVVIQEEESNAVSLATKKISFDEYAKYDVEPLAETAQLLTATVLPAGVTHTGVEWTLSWVNPSSSWSIGKNVEDYLTLTPTSEHALTATLSCLQAFGEQAKVTVTSRDDDTKKASSTIDYVQKVTDVSLYFGNVEINLGGETPVKYELREDVTGPGGEVFCILKTSSTYTIAETFEQSVTFGDYMTFMLYGQSIWGMYNQREGYGEGNLLGKNIYFDYMNDIQHWYIPHASGNEMFKDKSMEGLIQKLENEQYRDERLYEIKLIINGMYNTYLYDATIVYDGYTYTSDITGVSLAPNRLLF